MVKAGNQVVPRSWALEQDLDDVLQQAAPVWSELRGARLFITGGTGFIGCWLLESLRHADQRLDLGVRATVLTRDPQAFRQKAPHLADHPDGHDLALAYHGV